MYSMSTGIIPIVWLDTSARDVEEYGVDTAENKHHRREMLIYLQKVRKNHGNRNRISGYIDKSYHSRIRSAHTAVSIPSTVLEIPTEYV